MMNGWLMLDRIAASRGDGLNPALRELLVARATARDSMANVVDIAQARADAGRQSGPVRARETGDARKCCALHSPC